MKLIRRTAEVLAWTAFFVFAAAVLALRFWLLPKVESHGEEIAAMVERAIGRPVKIGAIEAGWLGLRPQITLANVRIFDDDGREALLLPEVDNVISWRSLLYRELRLHALVIDGPRLTVRRAADGTLYVAGLKLGPRPGTPGTRDWILGQEEIVVRNAEIEWLDEKRGAPPLALAALNLRLRSSGDEHSIGFTARPPAALGSTVELRAELAGRTFTDPAAWSGRLYAELGATDLAAWRAWVDYPLEVSQARGALRVWVTLENGALTKLTADVALAQVLARLAPDLPPLELAALQGRLHAAALDDGYELGARNLVLTAVDGPPMRPTDFSVRWGGSAAAQHGSAGARLIEFAPLLHFAGSLPMPPEVRSLIAELRPSGRIADAQFDWQGGFAAPQRFSARARFSELGLGAWRGAPGFAGLSGSVEASEKKGRLQLASRKAEFDLPEIFPEPRLALDALNGQVEWERQDAGGVALRFTSVSFANADASGSAYGTYTRSGPGPGSIDLVATLTRADGSKIGKYLPHGRLLGEESGQKLRDWLVQAIVGGQASDVRARLKGDLRDFPFRDPAQGQFLVTAHVQRGVLDYVRDWPRIDGVDGELQFERDSMLIVGRSGSILGAHLSNVRVSIPVLSRDPHLLVEGQASGPTQEFLRFIAASPVKRRTGGLIDSISAQGNGALHLKLDLPLAELRSSKVAGEFSFSGNSVTLHPQLPVLEHATGGLGFTDEGFTLHRTGGRLFGAPVELAGGSRPGGGVELTARGRNVNVAGVSFIEKPWRDYLSGATSYVATLALRDGQARLRVDSSLRGVASTLPAPLAKDAGDALPLRLEVMPADGGTRDRVSLSLGRLAAAEILRRKQGAALVVQRAGLSLTPEAGQPVRLPERPGTLVYGSLPALDLDSWLALAPARSSGAFGGTAVDLKIAALDAYGKRLSGVTVRGGADAVSWSLSVNAEELSGDLSYRGGSYIARFDRLSIPPDSPGAKRGREMRPAEMPAIDLVAERFNLRGKELGQLMLAASPQGGEWRIDKLGMVSDDATLQGSGVWRGREDGASRSDFQFELDAANAGSFLARVGYANVVKGGKANFSGALSWQGDPTRIDFASLDGELKLGADEGQFLEIDPGFGKLLSLMSLQQLPRRIGLDFRDVFSKGFQFTHIDAEARVDKGVMALKAFKMTGSAAEVAMTGQVDLARETQDLRVRVVPGIGDAASLPLAIVSPPIGVAAAIAQQVLKNPLGQMFAYNYSVTGSWSDPKVAKIAAPRRERELEGVSP